MNTTDRKIFVDAVRIGNTCISESYDDSLSSGYDLRTSDYSGYIDAEELPENVLEAIAKDIESGKDFGIAAHEPWNVEWYVERERDVICKK